MRACSNPMRFLQHVQVGDLVDRARRGYRVKGRHAVKAQRRGVQPYAGDVALAAGNERSRSALDDDDDVVEAGLRALLAAVIDGAKDDDLGAAERGCDGDAAGGDVSLDRFLRHRRRDRGWRAWLRLDGRRSGRIDRGGAGRWGRIRRCGNRWRTGAARGRCSRQSSPSYDRAASDATAKRVRTTKLKERNGRAEPNVMHTPPVRP